MSEQRQYESNEAEDQVAEGVAAGGRRMSEPLTVSFTIEPGDVWIDPDGMAWSVERIGDAVYVERTITEAVDAVTLARTWRKLRTPGGTTASRERG